MKLSDQLLRQQKRTVCTFKLQPMEFIVTFQFCFNFTHWNIICVYSLFIPCQQNSYRMFKITAFESTHVIKLFTVLRLNKTIVYINTHAHTHTRQITPANKSFSYSGTMCNTTNRLRKYTLTILQESGLVKSLETQFILLNCKIPQSRPIRWKIEAENCDFGYFLENFLW